MQNKLPSSWCRINNRTDDNKPFAVTIMKWIEVTLLHKVFSWYLKRDKKVFFTIPRVYYTMMNFVPLMYKAWPTATIPVGNNGNNDFIFMTYKYYILKCLVGRFLPIGRIILNWKFSHFIFSLLLLAYEKLSVINGR